MKNIKILKNKAYKLLAQSELDFDSKKVANKFKFVIKQDWYALNPEDRSFLENVKPDFSGVIGNGVELQIQNHGIVTHQTL